MQRAIGAVCRSVAYNYAISEDPANFKKVVVDDELIRESLGNPKFDFKMNERITKPGIAIVRRASLQHIRDLPTPKWVGKPS